MVKEFRKYRVSIKGGMTNAGFSFNEENGITDRESVC